LQKQKCVPLEDLAAEFKLRTQVYSIACTEGYPPFSCIISFCLESFYLQKVMLCTSNCLLILFLWTCLLCVLCDPVHTSYMQPTVYPIYCFKLIWLPFICFCNNSFPGQYNVVENTGDQYLTSLSMYRIVLGNLLSSCTLQPYSDSIQGSTLCSLSIYCMKLIWLPFCLHQQ